VLGNSSPLRQHNERRGQGSSRPATAAAADKSNQVYTRMIRMAAAMQQVS